MERSKTGVPSEKILIVDDNPQNLRVLFTLLSKEGYDIRPVLNADQALLSVNSSIPPDLILLNIMMPEMDGFQLFEELSRSSKNFNIPVIFISEKNHMNDKRKGFSLEGVDYITKPFNKKEVLARIKTQMVLRNQSQKLLRTELSTQNKKITNESTERTILIVDDTPANCKLLKIMLDTQKYIVIVAETGKQAIHHVTKNDPDIILMDMMLPDMDGAEVIKQIRLNPNMKKIPVIAVSAIIGIKNFHEYRPLGFDDYIVKPVSPNDLNTSLNKHLNLT